jgi:TonB-dependent receptor
MKRTSLLLVFATILASAASAAGTGAIEGRVYLPSDDRYLDNATVTLAIGAGAGAETRTTLTDDIGSYQFAGIPAGPVTLTASFPGVPPRTLAAEIRPGQTTQLDINLGTGASPGDGVTPRPPATAGTETADGIVKLETFTVNADRSETGSAFARAAQQNATDMRIVIDADEFGENPSGNIGEFMKHIPGINIISSNGEPRDISMDGASPDHVPITFAGFSLANAASGSQSRRVELEGVSLVSLSRIEVFFSPTAETEGRALAGSVNIVPRSAFEYRRPRLDLKTYVTFEADAVNTNKTPGPWFTPTRKYGPNLALSYIVPVNKKFGFTVAANRSYYYTSKEYQRTYWRGSADTVGDSAGHFPVTDVEHPYMSGIDLTQGSSLTERAGFSITADYRLTYADRLSFAFQYGWQDIKFNNRALNLIMQHLDTDTAGILGTDYSEGYGYVRQHQEARRKTNTTYMPTLTWRHTGPQWKMNAGIAYSHATSHYNDTPYGFFYSANADRGNVKIIFDDIHYDGPRSISVTVLDGDNRAINPYALDDLNLTTVYARGHDSYDEIANGYFDIRRDLTLGAGTPLFLKAGYNYKHTKRGRYNASYHNLRYLGADGVYAGAGNNSTTGIMNPPASLDDGASAYLDPAFSSLPVGFGHPKIQWVDLASLYQMYQTTPGYFYEVDTSTSNEVENAIVNLWDVAETIHSAWFRSDLYMFNQRLKIIPGVRVERTEIHGRGPLRTNIGGRMTWVKYGAKSATEYTNLFPRVNIEYEILPDRELIARAAYFESIGRPSFNQYVGELTMPDRSSAGSANNNRFSMKNSEIEPWTSKTFSAGIEWYYAKTASLTLRAFTREIDKFFIDTVEPVTPALLDHYGLDASEYDGYYIVTQKNSSRPATLRGLSISWKQRLDFLPRWARGISMHANATFQHITGPGQASLVSSDGSFRPRAYNAGITLARKKYTLSASWNHAGETKTGINSQANVPAGTYTWIVARNPINISGEYRFKHCSLYFSLQNITGEPDAQYEIRGPNTPAKARFRSIEDYGPRYTFGLKANF